MTTMNDERPEMLARYEGCGCGGEHRTVGSRAWCLDCHEWCYPSTPCQVEEQRIELDRLRALVSWVESACADELPHLEIQAAIERAKEGLYR